MNVATAGLILNLAPEGIALVRDFIAFFKRHGIVDPAAQEAFIQAVVLASTTKEDSFLALIAADEATHPQP